MPYEGSTINGTRQRPVSRFLGQYVIKHHFQFKFSLILFAVFCLSTFILWLESQLAVNHFISTGLITSEESVVQIKLLSGIIGKTGILINTLTFGLLLFLSHFIAGPLYRFERTFDEMKNGNLSMHVRLREHDELKDVADSLNNGMAGLRHLLQAEYGAMDKLNEKAVQLSEMLRKSGKSSEADYVEEMMRDFQSNTKKIKLIDRK